MPVRAPSLKHYPDKPIEQGPSALAVLDNGCNICQQKTDGWRLETCKTLKGIIAFISRHNTSMDGSVEPHIMKQMALIMELMPNGSQLDGEWLSRREATNKKTKPRYVLFDVIRRNKRWMHQKPYSERWALLQDIFNQAVEAYGREALADISLAETAEDGEFEAFYEAQKKLAHSEGVVIKHKDSTLLADRKECKDNPRWIKIRYRGASDGAMTMDHLRVTN
jgi:ATP-dependent DNA ligase